MEHPFRLDLYDFQNIQLQLNFYNTKKLQGLLKISKVSESERVRDQGKILNYICLGSHTSPTRSQKISLSTELTS
jgi:hypothetical protein